MFSNARLTHDAKTKYRFAIPSGTERAVTLLKMLRADHDSVSNPWMLQYLLVRDVQKALISLLLGRSESLLPMAAKTR
jgi:hypothetical protein